MDLMANTIMLHNVSDLTNVLTGMAADGWPLTKDLVGRLSPYTRSPPTLRQVHAGYG